MSDTDIGREMTDLCRFASAMAIPFGGGKLVKDLP